MSARQDWWYVRAYPGDATLMDRAAETLLPWLRDLAAREGADRWFFVRYWDLTGHHLRLRLRLGADAADRLHGRLDDVVGLLRGLPAAGEARRLVTGAAPMGTGGARHATTCLYAPELAKYGGTRGVGLAEELFTASSAWIAGNSLIGFDQPGARARLAVTFMRGLIEAALPAAGHQEFWAAHRRQWGGQLRVLVRTQPELNALLGRVADGVAQAEDVTGRLRHGLDEHVGQVVAALDRAEREDNPVPRPVLLLHYLHMEMNRWGFVPAEECGLGVLAASTG
ncbi:hypothetical protein Skr01_21660 [Sphaerisporangium krabiense]|uniref:Thiopeptide-type bacteriocin biosynthesis protein n=1 Tax=Sphaerisporangium krabiense TaxID=763782 RepID=A0A7W9DQW1_9ACTN|nr:thiopeptide-type bacteriocin biosynthesis protein [Sphaerisporangium krabiense]MBB5627921.1 thiopeptide-type bacteriocin biosynthesis protein [Sphaerisporangium krabiense]GII62081.1 hypothetical protein Skr01_21660 [Sphaerisporangium krabiense]